MTDEALAGGELAPAEAPALELDQVRLPNPIQATLPTREAEPEKAKPAPPSASEAIKRAQEQVKAKEAEKAKPAKTEETKPDKARDETTGKFAARQPAEQPQQAKEPAPAVQRPYDPTQPHRDAPSRFSPDAKAAWEAAPDAIKAETHRAIRELEQGHLKYKADAENYDKVRQYDELARKNGGDLAQSLQKVRDFEDTFARDPMQGFQKVADHFGISMHAVAAHILNQNPDEARYGQEQTIASLKQELATLKQELSGLTPIVQEYKTSSDERTLKEWAADKPHFDDLRAEVTAYVKQGYDPDTAYQQAVEDVAEKARKFGFAPVETPAASSAAPQPKPLNPAGQKSITGAPVTGSNPTGRKQPPPSIREALRRAQAQVG